MLDRHATTPTDTATKQEYGGGGSGQSSTHSKPKTTYSIHHSTTPPTLPHTPHYSTPYTTVHHSTRHPPTPPHHTQAQGGWGWVARGSRYLTPPPSTRPTDIWVDYPREGMRYPQQGVGDGGSEAPTPHAAWHRTLHVRLWRSGWCDDSPHPPTEALIGSHGVSG